MSEVIEFALVQQRLLAGTWVTVDRITSSDQSLTDGTHSYRPVAVGRTPIEASEQEQREELTITLPVLDDISQMVIPGFPEQPLRFTVYRATEFTRDPDQIVATTFETVYIGVVAGARLTGSLCEFRLRPPHRALDLLGPRQRYQRMCRWDLYGAGCGVNKADHETFGTVVVGADPAPLNYTDYVFSDAFGAPLSSGDLSGGTLILRGLWVRQISSHSADASPDAPNKPYVKIVSPFPVDIADGDEVNAYPGCNHSSTHCKDKFNNIDNFGGFGRVARDNPFRGNL